MTKKLHSILNVMRRVDIGGHIDIPYKKVGITGSGSATLSSSRSFVEKLDIDRAMR